MFVDVVFPDNNEQEFIEIAKKLDTTKLCFVYKDKKRDIKSDLKIYYGSLNIKKQNFDFYLTKDLKIKSKSSKLIYYYDEINPSKSFHYPLNNNHVLFKDLKEKYLGISFNYLLWSKKYPEVFEYLKFVIKLANKYKVKLFIASFAKDPYELRSKTQLHNIMKTLSKNTKISWDSVHNLDKLFTLI